MKMHILAATAFVAMSGVSFGQTMNHDSMGKMNPSETSRSSSMADGEVRKVDKQQGSITLHHGEIKSAKMAPMTMAYKAKDPSLLEKVAPGDKVRFSLEQAKGSYLITAIERR